LKALGLVPLNGHVAQTVSDTATVRQAIGHSLS